MTIPKLNFSRPFIICVSLSIVIHVLWNLALFPSIMTPDSYSQWNQLVTGKYDDWHPYFHTLFFLWPIKFIFSDPYAVAIVQQIWSIALFSWIFAYFYKNKISNYALIPLFVIYLFSVPIGAYNMIIWKDIAFCYALITLSFWLYKKLKSNSPWMLNDYLVYSVLLVYSSFLRHNGIVFLLFVPILLLFIKQRQFKIKFLGAISILSFLVFSLLLPEILNIKTKPYWYKYSNIYHISAGLYVNKPHTSTTKKTDKLLTSVLPDSVIKKKFNPVLWHTLHLENPEFNNSVFNSKNFWSSLNKEFFKHNLPNNLPYIMGMKTRQTTTILNGYGFIFYPSYASPKYSNVEKSWFGRKTQKFRNTLRGFVSRNINAYNRKPILRSLIWNNWLPLLILIYCWLSAYFKSYNTSWVSLSIPLIQASFVAVFAVSNDWRYMFFVYLSLFISIPMYLLDKKDINNETNA